MIKHDEQENDPKLGPIIKKVLDEEFYKIQFRGIGMCHILWKNTKKRLKEEYNIDWKTPAEMNPDILFD